MPEAFEVIIPLLNPNEPEVQVVETFVKNGDSVAVGDRLCIVETTKSSHEILAEGAGYVIGFGQAQGDKLNAGARLCWLADDASWEPPKDELVDPAVPTEGASIDVRITQPALALAREKGIDLDELPAGALITEEVVQRFARAKDGEITLPDFKVDADTLIIYGGGGHGKALIDLIRAIGSLTIAGIVDDGLPVGEEIMGVSVLGGGEILGALAERGITLAVNAVGGIGDMSSRTRVFQRLSAAGFEYPNLIHPTAWVEPGAMLQGGAQIFPHTYVGSEAHLGLGVIVNTAAVVSHDCDLKDYVNIAPGALLAGNVKVGEGSLVGMGVTINLNVEIGPGAMIGNSAVVKTDVPAGQVVRAGSVWPPKHEKGR